MRNPTLVSTIRACGPQRRNQDTPINDDARPADQTGAVREGGKRATSRDLHGEKQRSNVGGVDDGDCDNDDG
jgi:hypothetical protein